MIGHFVQLIEAAIREPKARIAELELLRKQEKQQILGDFSAMVEYPRDKTIHELFEEQVERTPDNIAVVFQGQELTYRELNARANGLAWVLREKGVQRDSLVGLMTERSLEMIVGMLAILKAGGAYVPVDPSYPEERIAFILRDSKVEVVVTDRPWEDEKRLDSSASSITVLPITDPEFAKGDPTNLPVVSHPESLAYIIYTSGTTGVPKGVMVEHRNVVQLMFQEGLPFKFRSDDVWTLFHAYGFDFSVWEMYGALLYGGRSVIVPKEVAQDPASFLKLLITEQVTVLNQTPTAFYGLVREVGEQTPALRVRYVIFGGEALQPKTLQAWKKKYPEMALVNMYGITETTVHVTYKEITEADIVAGHSVIGRPLPALRAYVMDARKQLVPFGIAGELYVGGAGVTRGYLNREELTQERFVTNPYNPDERLYRSGDLVKQSANGELEYLGRVDHQVKIRGYRIELGEIEAGLLQDGHVKEAIVLARQNEQGQNELCAYVVGEGELTLTQLRGALAQKLPSHMIPAHFVQLEKMPLTPNGKIDRKALPAPEGKLSTGVAYDAPRSETERALAEIWQEILGVAQAGAQDNFFDLGGHSLRAMTLVSQIHQKFEVGISLRDVFQHPTLEGLAAEIAMQAKSVYAAIPLAKSGRTIRYRRRKNGCTY